MPNTPSPTSTVTIHDLADRIAAYRALDLLLFEVIGSWITDATSAAVRPYYAAWSQHHAWHAELWTGRFPVIPDLDVHAATTAAAERMEPVADVLRSADTESARVSLLADHLLPQLATILEQHRDEVVPELDAPTARVLDLVIDDLHRDTTMARQLYGPTSTDTDTDTDTDTGRGAIPTSTVVDLAAAFG